MMGFGLSGSYRIVWLITLSRIDYCDIRIATGTNGDSILLPLSLKTPEPTISWNAWAISETTTKSLNSAPIV